MKKLQLLLGLLFFTFFLHSENLVDVMRKVNKEVNNQSDLPAFWKSEQAFPANFNEAIQIHLLHVEEVLKARNIEQLSSSQRANREQLLNKLHAYALAMRFPINLHYSFQTPIFIDDFDTHCAVGYLMQQSGNDRLAREISQKQNLAYVPEIQVNGVSAWASEHGFSLSELAWIQPGYPPNTIITPLLNGMNGTVYTMAEYQGNLYAAGSFDTADVNIANNIAVYISGFAGYLWTDVDGGINGEIRKLFDFEGSLIAGGDFTSAGGIQARSIARLNNGQWEAMGAGLDGIVYDIAVYQGNLYAFGDFDIIGSDTNGKDVAIWNGTSWDDIGLGTDGAVYAALSFDGKLYYGGEFNMVNNTEVKNIAEYTGQSINNIAGPNVTPIYDIIDWNGTLTCSGNIKYDTLVQGIIQFNGEQWSTLAGLDEVALFDTTAEFRSLLVLDGELIVTGKFYIESFMVFGRGLAKWQNEEAFPEPLAIFEETVFTSLNYGGLHVGGSFHDQFIGAEINAIARVDDFVTSTSQPLVGTNLKLEAYPNPSENGIVYLKNTEGLEWVKLYDTQGKLIKRLEMKSKNELLLPSDGFFILESNLGDHIRLLRK
ncbi:MAG: hypothetical protein WED33_09760 [Bacteroidia bacterium]